MRNCFGVCSLHTRTAAAITSPTTRKAALGSFQSFIRTFRALYHVQSPCRRAALSGDYFIVFSPINRSDDHVKNPRQTLSGQSMCRRHTNKRAEVGLCPTGGTPPKERCSQKRETYGFPLLSDLSVLAPTYSRTPKGTTIGAGGLNCCVRDGNRCDPTAKGTRTERSKTEKN